MGFFATLNLQETAIRIPVLSVVHQLGPVGRRRDAENGYDPGTPADEDRGRRVDQSADAAGRRGRVGFAARLVAGSRTLGCNKS